MCYNQKQIIKAVNFLSQSSLDWARRRWKALPKVDYLVRKNGTEKSQDLHYMVRPFTPREPEHEVEATSQNCKPEPDVIS